MTNHTGAVAANAAFYEAFAKKDYVAMDALWARLFPVSCLHPGWPPLIGREVVMRSWRDVMRDPEPVALRIDNVRTLEYGPGAVMVLCAEVLGGQAVLAASNLFVIEDGVWRLVFHQAGQVATPMESVATAGSGSKGGRVVH